MASRDQDESVQILRLLQVRANQESPGIGGHISTYASAATLWEVGFNHFWRGRTAEFLGNMVYFQGHDPDKVYAPTKPPSSIRGRRRSPGPETPPHPPLQHHPPRDRRCSAALRAGLATAHPRKREDR